MKNVETNPGKSYSVHSSAGCTVSDDTGWSKTLEAPEDYFTAHRSKVYVDDDTATVRELFSAAPAAGGGGGGSTSGERVAVLNGAELTMQHATWFNNSEHPAVTILPAGWQNKVVTCYLKTAVPVELSGVTWIYGQPTMIAGYIYVIALQQIDASTVLANLAYTLPL